MKIILFEPQIPQNTGNIVRTCSVTGSSLLLVQPLGFAITDKKLKRAGLDYWEGVDVTFTDNLLQILENTENNFYFFSSKVKTKYSDIRYTENDFLIFGSETSGLPEEFVSRWPEKFATIPMIEGARCLNLATSVGIVAYEALRQQHFDCLSKTIKTC